MTLFSFFQNRCYSDLSEVRNKWGCAVFTFSVKNNFLANKSNYGPFSNSWWLQGIIWKVLAFSIKSEILELDQRF